PGKRRSSMLSRRFVVRAIATAAVAIAAPRRLFAQRSVQTQTIDPFGQEITLPEKSIVYASGTGDWETAYETLTEAFKALQAFLDKKGIKPAGPAMTIYTAMDDLTFNFQAAVPVAELPKGPPQDNIGAGTSPGGKALKFVHRGSFEAMTAT